MAASELTLVADIAGFDLAGGPATASAWLSAALDAAPFSSVLLIQSNGAPFAPAPVKTLIEIIQRRNAAALLADDAQLVRILKADGVHLSWSKDQPRRYADAREELGQRFIVGADAGRSRDDAMSLGEAGADYIGFGIPAHVEDRATAFDRQCALIGWWREIFEPPCVAFDCASAEDARALAEAGADFIAVTISADQPPVGVSARIKAFAQAIEDVKITA